MCGKQQPLAGFRAGQIDDQVSGFGRKGNAFVDGIEADRRFRNADRNEVVADRVGDQFFVTGHTFNRKVFHQVCFRGSGVEMTAGVAHGTSHCTIIHNYFASWISPTQGKFGQHSGFPCCKFMRFPGAATVLSSVAARCASRISLDDELILVEDKLVRFPANFLLCFTLRKFKRIVACSWLVAGSQRSRARPVPDHGPALRDRGRMANIFFKPLPGKPLLPSQPRRRMHRNKTRPTSITTLSSKNSRLNPKSTDPRPHSRTQVAASSYFTDNSTLRTRVSTTASRTLTAWSTTGTGTRVSASP